MPRPKTLTVADNGIGMNREDLIENLGTIARSGTAAFMNKLTGDAKKDVGLIGQFGVGFYSAFMVADKVEVLTRKAGESQGWRWESDGRGDFTVSEAADVPRGTRVVLHLKADEGEFLEESRLRRIVQKYSDHIALPIVYGEGDEAQTLNKASALWTRSRNEITPEQYKEFYHHVGHAFDEPWLTLHWRAEGKIEYTSLLFVPAHQAVRPVQPGPPPPRQAVCPARLHHRRGRRAGAALSALPARRGRQRGPAAQHQPRDAAAQPDAGQDPQRHRAPGAGRSRQEGRGRRAGRSLRHVLGKLRRRAQGRPLRGLRAPRAAHQAAALPHHRRPRGWCRWTIISAG